MKNIVFIIAFITFSGVGNTQVIKVKKKQGQETEEVIEDEIMEVEMPAPEIASRKRLDRGVYEEEGKFGLKFNDKIITQAIYDRIYLVEKYDSRYFVTKDGKQGVIDNTGKQLLSCTYDFIRKVSKNSKVYKVTTNQKTGVFDSEENEVIPMIYDYISETDFGYSLTLEGEKGLANKQGVVIFPTEYDQIFEYGEGSDFVILKRNEKYSVATKTGEFIRKDNINQIYRINDTRSINSIRYKQHRRDRGQKLSDVLSFIDSNELAGVIDFKQGEIIIPPTYTAVFQHYQGHFIVKKGDKFGLINSDNRLIINFDYDSLLIENPDDRKDVSSIITFKKGKCGLIDFKGKSLTPSSYSSIESIYNGKYKAKKGDKEYYILNQNGSFFVDESFLQVGIFDLGKAAVFNKNGLYYMDTNGISTSSLTYHEGYSAINQIEDDFILALKAKDDQLLKEFVEKISISAYTLEYMERIRIEYKGFPNKITYSNYYTVDQIKENYFNELKQFKDVYFTDSSIKIKSEIRISDVKQIRDKERRYREYYIVEIRFYMEDIHASIVLDNFIFLDGSWISFSSSIKNLKRNRR